MIEYRSQNRRDVGVKTTGMLSFFVKGMVVCRIPLVLQLCVFVVLLLRRSLEEPPRSPPRGAGFARMSLAKAPSELFAGFAGHGTGRRRSGQFSRGPGFRMT